MIQLQNNRSIMLLSTLFIVVTIGALYYFLLFPKQEEVAAQRMINETTSSTINQLREERIQLEQLQKNPISPLELRQVLPEKRDYQGILNTIEAFEYMTVSKIDSVTFNEFGNSILDSGLLEETDTSLEEPAGDEAITEEVEKQTTIDISLLPEQLKMVSFTVDARFENTDELVKFMRLIESGERAIKIESVQFSEQDELEKVQNLPYPVQVNFEMVTFYYEEGVE